MENFITIIKINSKHFRSISITVSVLSNYIELKKTQNEAHRIMAKPLDICIK